MPKESGSLEDRVKNLETAVEYLSEQIADVAAAREAADQKDWPRRSCDAAGCKTVMRRQDAAELPKFCPEHTEAA